MVIFLPRKGSASDIIEGFAPIGEALGMLAGNKLKQVKLRNAYQQAGFSPRQAEAVSRMPAAQQQRAWQEFVERGGLGEQALEQPQQYTTEVPYEAAPQQQSGIELPSAAPTTGMGALAPTRPNPIQQAVGHPLAQAYRASQIPGEYGAQLATGGPRNQLEAAHENLRALQQATNAGALGYNAPAQQLAQQQGQGQQPNVPAAPVKAAGAAPTLATTGGQTPRLPSEQPTARTPQEELIGRAGDLFNRRNPQPPKAPTDVFGGNNPKIKRQMAQDMRAEEQLEIAKIDLLRKLVEDKYNQSEKELDRNWKLNEKQLEVIRENGIKAREQIRIYDNIIKLVTNGEPIVGAQKKLLDTLGISELNQNTVTQVLAKEFARLEQVSGVGGFAGTGKMTNFLEQRMARANPNLYNTPEGIVAVATLNRAFAQAEDIVDKERRHLTKLYKGNIPFDLIDQIHEDAERKIDDVFRQNAEDMDRLMGFNTDQDRQDREAIFAPGGTQPNTGGPGAGGGGGGGQNFTQPPTGGRGGGNNFRITPAAQNIVKTVGGSGARFLEGAGGVVGNRAQALHRTPTPEDQLNFMRNYHQQIGILGTPESNEKLAKLEQQIAESPKSYKGGGIGSFFPTSAQLREDTRYLSGQALEPSGPISSAVQNIAETAGGMVGSNILNRAGAAISNKLPARRPEGYVPPEVPKGMGAKRTLITAAAGTAAQKAAELVGFGPQTQAAAKVLTMMAASIYGGREQVEHVKNEKWNQAEEAAGSSTVGMKQSHKFWDDKIKDLKDLKDPRFDPVIKKMEDLKEVATLHTVSAKEGPEIRVATTKVMDLIKGVNNMLENENLDKQQVGMLKHISSALHKPLEELSKTNKAFGESYPIAKELHGALENQGVLVRFINASNRLINLASKNPIVHTILTGLGSTAIGGHYAGFPGAAAGAAAGAGLAAGVYSAARYNDLLKSPAASRIISKMVEDARAGLENEVAKGIVELNKEAKKYK